MTTQLVCGISAAIISLSAAAPSAVAQDVTFASTCQDVGRAAPEPLGDRNGHSITVADYSCRVDTGPLSGALMTGSAIWEWNGTEAVMLSNGGVLRTPDSTMIYRGLGL